MSHTMKILIAVSLLLNILLGGYILGSASRSMMTDRVNTTIEKAASTLPEEKREEFLLIMRQAQKDNAPLFKQLEANRAKAIKLLKAEDFNKKAFLNQMKEMEKIHSQLKNRLAQSIVDASDDLDADERILMAELLRRPPAPPEKNCPKPEAKD